MTNPFFQRSIISIFDLSREEIEQILRAALQLKVKPQESLLRQKILASCFFEPSTRTRLSFESAMLRLGGNTVGFDSAINISAGAKGENLSDTMRIVGQYADVIVLRHPREGAARLAAETAGVPVINAGDGSNQHPTQTLLDLFSIQETQGELEKLNIAFVGDLKYGRTIHSLVQACALFGMRMYFVGPDSLSLPAYLNDYLRQHRIKFSFHSKIEDVLPKLDILYMTRIQRERLLDSEVRLLTQQCVLNCAMLEAAKPNLKVLHPLPRVSEIESAVDNSEHAYYFQQAANGLYIRQAILALLLNKEIKL